MSDTADQLAAKRMAEVRPIWTGLALARDALDLPDRTLLHAGPPFPDQRDLPLPILNSAAHATRFEGWAEDATTAAAMIERGEIILDRQRRRVRHAPRWRRSSRRRCGCKSWKTKHHHRDAPLRRSTLAQRCRFPMAGPMTPRSSNVSGSSIMRSPPGSIRCLMSQSTYCRSSTPRFAVVTSVMA